MPSTIVSPAPSAGSFEPSAAVRREYQWSGHRRGVHRFPPAHGPELPSVSPDELLDFYAFIFCQGGFRHLGMTFEQFLSVVADRKSTRLNSSHPSISYAVFCLK